MVGFALSRWCEDAQVEEEDGEFGCEDQGGVDYLGGVGELFVMGSVSWIRRILVLGRRVCLSLPSYTAGDHPEQQRLWVFRSHACPFQEISRRRQSSPATLPVSKPPLS